MQFIACQLLYIRRGQWNGGFLRDQRLREITVEILQELDRERDLQSAFFRPEIMMMKHVVLLERDTQIPEVLGGEQLQKSTKAPGVFILLPQQLVEFVQRDGLQNVVDHHGQTAHSQVRIVSDESGRRLPEGVYLVLPLIDV